MLSRRIVMSRIVMAAENHFSHVKEISVDRISLVDEVRKMCEQNRCGQYGKNWTCPPAVGSIDAFRAELAQFDSSVVVYQVYSIKNSFDWNGMMSGITDFGKRLLAMKKEIEMECPRPRFLVLGAGSCRLCEECTYVQGEACRRPDDACVSIEACGIDVVRLMKDHGLNYHNGKNTVTYIGLIMYSSNGAQAIHRSV
jgi:predicted metal-binding protein